MTLDLFNRFMKSMQEENSFPEYYFHFSVPFYLPFFALLNPSYQLSLHLLFLKCLFNLLFIILDQCYKLFKVNILSGTVNIYIEIHNGNPNISISFIFCYFIFLIGNGNNIVDFYKAFGADILYYNAVGAAHCQVRIMYFVDIFTYLLHRVPHEK